jgi:hemoglobin
VNDDRTDLRSRDDVERLVRSFYRDAAMDDRLGPIFAAARVDWPSHIDHLTDLWCWQLLGERSYTGNPLRAHLPVHGRTPFTLAHFERWLELFTATVDYHFRGPTAEVAKSRAIKMATALRRILADRHHDAATSVHAADADRTAVTLAGTARTLPAPGPPGSPGRASITLRR